MRITRDVDTVLDFDRANLSRAAHALAELHARLRVEGLDDDAARALSVKPHGEWLGRMEISTWRTDLGAVDLLSHIPDLDGQRLDYNTLRSRATEFDFDGVTVQVASLDDIIASKRWANRPKDRDALPELEELQGQLDVETGRERGLDLDRASRRRPRATAECRW